MRRIATADHWRWVSSPRWRRASSKVTSSCQRWTNQPRICGRAAVRSVQSSAWVAKCPCGSRISTQRNGTGGSPLWYQTAVAEAISTVRWPAPYQWATVLGVQRYADRPHSGEGRQPRSLETRATDLVGSAGRGGRVERGVEPQARDDGDGRAPGATGGEELQRGVGAVGHGDDGALRPPTAHHEQQLARPVRQRLVPSPRSRSYRSEGASAVRTGSAHVRPAQGIGTRSIRQTQRSPLALTKWLWLERTGSR